MSYATQYVFVAGEINMREDSFFFHNDNYLCR